MNKISKNKQGFALFELLLIVLILSVISFGGYYVYNTNHKNGAVTTSVTAVKTSTASSNLANDPYSGWSTYESKLGGFTFKYPAGWFITGFHGETSFSQNQFNGNETELFVAEYDETTRVNNLGITVTISSSNSSNTLPFDDYPNGTTKLLTNGLTLWQEKQNINYANGPAVNTCPTLKIGNDDTYTTKLNNGKYVRIDASYCWAQGMSTNYTYQQQVDSAAYKDAIKVVESVKF